MRYLAIALLFLSATGYAQTSTTKESGLFDNSRNKGLIAWRAGAPDIEKPGKKANISDVRAKHSTINVRSLREELKGIGVYAFTSEASSRLSIQLNNYEKQSILIQLVDKAGQVVHSQFIAVDSDDEDYTLDISSFQASEYKLVLSNVKEKKMSVYSIERDRKI